MRENYYAFTVSVACYGADEELTVNFAFSGVNYDKTALSWSTVVPCSGRRNAGFCAGYLYVRRGGDLFL